MPTTDLDYYEVFELPMDKIFFDEDFNCRGEFSDKSVQTLANSIEQSRLKQPIVVQPMADIQNPVEGFDYRIVAGHRRFRAFQLLGRDKIPAFIREGEKAEEIHLENYKENVERHQISVVAEARWIYKTYPASTSTKAIAKDLGRSEVWVSTRRRLLNLPPSILKRLELGDLNSSDVPAILSAPDPLKKAQKILAAKKNKKQGKAPQTLTNRPSKDQVREKLRELLKQGYNVRFVQLFYWALCDLTQDETEEAFKWLETKKTYLE